ncbi:ATP-binding cassette domain-containing protein [Spiribacter sp. C176]|uniref:ATP-binding cassette domain-containing protein n=2 Tax=Spiribacter salilacus TaxID=2664894 RepID=A0A6N7QRL6_9GAMM|nr:ATP-binding cassette domain-containing protein [Spiribacter salilacus]
MILTMALLDMIGVASIMPFMGVLANPELVQTNAILNTAFTAAGAIGVTTTDQFLFLLGIMVFVLLVVSLAFKALTTYAQLRFTLMREYSIGKRLVEGYLHQPYSWFLSRHSADLGKTILSEVNEVIGGGITPMMHIIAHGAVALSLLTLLVFIDPKLALVVGLTLTAAYALVFKITRGFLTRIGQERVKANRWRFTAVSEAFGAPKEIKVAGLEQAYIDRFSDPARTYARHQASAQVISQLPRFALEAIAFGGMLLVVLYLMAQSGSFASALPIIALYAFAGYRLMPALQQIYGAVTQLRFAGPAIDALHKDLMSLQPANPHQAKAAMPLTQAITLNDVQYTYPNAPQPALKNLSLTIPAKSTVGLVGATGSGKTTTVDLILGLLEAQEGTLEVDGQAIIEHNRRAWQRAIGYVPQQIYLADDTVAANIAFGLQEKDIDQAAVERAAKIANLHEFVANELPQQYQTTVGERGVRLSGGQRQRIGIARALYHNPQVLILDEATSALDNLTEQAVMEAVHNLGHEITIILIAHRLSTVKACDTIFLLEKGELKAQGTFDELTQADERFRAMAVTGYVVK